MILRVDVRFLRFKDQLNRFRVVHENGVMESCARFLVAQENSNVPIAFQKHGSRTCVPTADRFHEESATLLVLSTEVGTGLDQQHKSLNVIILETVSKRRDDLFFFTDAELEIRASIVGHKNCS